MRRPDGGHTRGGFSLIELIAVIAVVSLLAGAMAPLGLRQLNARRVERTRSDMATLVRAMAGDPGSGEFGYLGEMGGLPPTLEDLNSDAGKPPFVISLPGIGYGYNGPYAARLRLGTANRFVDAWDVPFQYTATTAQVSSSGPDRVAGNADDLVWPPEPLATQGNLVVQLLGVPNSGDPAAALADADADVFVASSNAGVFQEVAMNEPLGGPGPWSASGLHVGHHAVRAVGTGAFAGAIPVRRVATLERGTVVLTMTLVQP